MCLLLYFTTTETPTLLVFQLSQFQSFGAALKQLLKYSTVFKAYRQTNFSVDEITLKVVATWGRRSSINLIICGHADDVDGDGSARQFDLDFLIAKRR